MSVALQERQQPPLPDPLLAMEGWSAHEAIEIITETRGFTATMDVLINWFEQPPGKECDGEVCYQNT